MTNNLRLGDYNTLTVVKTVDFGLYLDGGPAGEILLPARYVEEGTQVGDEVEVFLYLDQQERLVATTEHPKARVGEFAYLPCSWVNEHGAFLDWGLMKDLFCPFREQKKRMERDNSYIVYIYVDPESYRIVASAKVDKYLSKEPPAYHQGEEVDLLIWQKTELGFKAIVNNSHAGLLYADQIYTDIHSGDRMKGYIAQVRGDGKIDLSLQPSGRQQTEQFAAHLLRYLEARGGRCHLCDNSSPEEIKSMFGVSKKTFKRAVGELYKQRRIRLFDDHIELSEESRA